MVELGTRGTTERVPGGNSPPTVVPAVGDPNLMRANGATLTPGKTRTPRGRHPGVGSRGREARTTTDVGESTQRMASEARKRHGDSEFTSDTEAENCRGHELSRLRPTASHSRQSLTIDRHGGRKTCKLNE